MSNSSNDSDSDFNSDSDSKDSISSPSSPDNNKQSPDTSTPPADGKRTLRLKAGAQPRRAPDRSRNPQRNHSTTESHFNPWTQAKTTPLRSAKNNPAERHKRSSAKRQNDNPPSRNKSRPATTPWSANTTPPAPTPATIAAAPFILYLDEHLPADGLAQTLLSSAQVVADVINGRSLAQGQLKQIPPPQRPAVQHHSMTTLRDYGAGDFLLQQLVNKPLDNTVCRALLLVALGLLQREPERAYVVVDQTVQAAKALGFSLEKPNSAPTPFLASFVNAVLRRFLREQEALNLRLSDNPAAFFCLPPWWLQRLQTDYPNNWQHIARHANTAPPMALRVNVRQNSRAEYLQKLNAAGIRADGKNIAANGVDHGELQRRIDVVGQTEPSDATEAPAVALLLQHACPVEQLPEFSDGKVSVQDLGAQRAVPLLLAHSPALLSHGGRVLDACAAPGGKSAQLLECAPQVQLTMLDIDPQRCRRIQDNLSRLHLAAPAPRCADAARVRDWWDGQPFHAILLDAPCSASGVVRRHPDSKWLRRDEDITFLARTQQWLLKSLWPLLTDGGTLLYATCSLFADENSRTIDNFLQYNANALLCHQEQCLPCAEHDGFFYACLRKKALNATP